MENEKINQAGKSTQEELALLKQQTEVLRKKLLELSHNFKNANPRKD
jgi:hypothetical protein